MKKITKLLVVALAAILSVGIAACGSNKGSSATPTNVGRSVADIQKSGSIKIATFGDLPPYGYKDNQGNYTGYDVELAQQIAKDLGVKIEWTQVNADARVSALQANKVDLVLANFTKTDERAKTVDFALPYMKVSVGVASPKSAPLTSADQLNGKQIAVTKGTTAEQYIMQNLSQVQLQHFDSKTQQFDALKQNSVQGLADDNTYLYAWVKDNPDYTVGIKELGDASTINPAVVKGNASLLSWVNDEITKLTDQGFFTQDFNSQLKPYFSSDIVPDDVIMQPADLKK